MEKKFVLSVWKYDPIGVGFQYPAQVTWEFKATVTERGSCRSSAVQEQLPTDLQTTEPPRWNTGTWAEETSESTDR